MIILAMYVNYTDFTPAIAQRTNEEFIKLADKLLLDGIRVIIIPIKNDVDFLNKVECIYPHFVVMNREEIEKIENLDKAIKDSLNVDTIIETLMKRIYQPEKQIGQI